MVDERVFSETERPENFESRTYPRQRRRLINELMAASLPVSYASDGPAEERKRRLKTIETT